MRYRDLGNTGLKVSEIGFGTIPILAGNAPVLTDYFSPDEDTAIQIMEKAYNYGCNFYDTAIKEEYGDAEYKLGLFAKKIGRDNIIIASKARFYDYSGIYREVFNSYKNLGTEPDIYFVHQVEPKHIDQVFSIGGALDALCDLKKQGIIKFTGIATHHAAVIEKCLDDDRVDIIQMSGNIFERGMLEKISKHPNIHNKGIILNKVYGAGTLCNVFDCSTLIGGILQYPFSSALLGLGTFEQVDIALKEEPKRVDYTIEEVLATINKKYKPIKCIRCQNCTCEYGLEPHIIFRQYNYFHMGKNHWALNKMEMNIKDMIDKCSKCVDMSCMQNCTMKLHIPEQIERCYHLVNQYRDL